MDGSETKKRKMGAHGYIYIIRKDKLSEDEMDTIEDCAENHYTLELEGIEYYTLYWDTEERDLAGYCRDKKAFYAMLRDMEKDGRAIEHQLWT